MKKIIIVILLLLCIGCSLPKKEVEEKKVAIMQAITEKCGAQSEAHGIVVSMPVDEVAGLNTYASL